jgi:hypothetical protein
MKDSKDKGKKGVKGDRDGRYQGWIEVRRGQR